MNGHLVPSHLAFVVQLAVEQLPEVKCIVNGLNDTHALVALILLAQAPPVHVVRPGRPDGTHKEAGAKTQFLCGRRRAAESALGAVYLTFMRMLPSG